MIIFTHSSRTMLLATENWQCCSWFSANISNVENIFTSSFDDYMIQRQSFESGWVMNVKAIVRWQWTSIVIRLLILIPSHWTCNLPLFRQWVFMMCCIEVGNDGNYTLLQNICLHFRILVMFEEVMRIKVRTVYLSLLSAHQHFFNGRFEVWSYAVRRYLRILYKGNWLERWSSYFTR